MCEVTTWVRSTSVSSEFGIFFRAVICTSNAIAESIVSRSDRACYYLVPRNSL